MVPLIKVSALVLEERASLVNASSKLVSTTKKKKVGQWEDQTERAGKELRRVREYLNWARFESLKVKLHAKEDIARKRFSAWKMDKSKEIFSLADPLLVPFRLSLPLQVWLDTSNLSPIHPTKVKF